MRMAAITRYQAGQLRELLDLAGWSQRELAARSGVSAHRISCILNLRARMRPHEIECLNHAFSKAGIPAQLFDDWPEGWKGLPRDKQKVVQIQEVPLDHLLVSKEVKQIAAPEVNRQQLAEQLNELTAHLEPDELELLWLRDAEQWPMSRIEKHFGWNRGIGSLRYSKVIWKIRKSISENGNSKKANLEEVKLKHPHTNSHLMRFPDEEPFDSEVKKLYQAHDWHWAEHGLRCSSCGKIIPKGDRFYVPVNRLRVLKSTEH